MSVGHKVDGAIGTAYYPRLRKRTRTLPIVQQERDLGGALECRLCGKFMNCMTSHLPRVHGLSCTDYRLQFGSHLAVHSKESLAKRSATHQLRYGLFSCQWCGITGFLRSQKWQLHRQGKRPKFCGPACHFQWRSVHKHVSGTLPRKCQWCGSTFIVTMSYAKAHAALYCSVACRWHRPTTAAPHRP